MTVTKRIHVHLGGLEEAHSLDLNEVKTVAMLIPILLATGKLGEAKAEEIFIFEEDSEVELPPDFCFTPEHHGKRFHAHRCREIKVALVHVDETKEHLFRPGATIGRLLQWAKDHFPVDKGRKYALRLTAEGEALPHAAHLGTYVKGRPCSITLYFAPACNIQG